MPDAHPVSRNAIVRALVDALEPLPWVDAFWEGGSAAFGRLDAYSDLDLYAVVADDMLPQAFRVVEAALESLSPIRTKYEPSWPPESGTAQAFYRLEAASEYLLVDLAIFKRSARDKYLEPEFHGNAVFAFNKGDAVLIPTLDRDAFVAKLLERRDRLRIRVGLFGPFVAKELLRRNGLGALEAYHKIVLDSLLQVLWMRHHPAHYTFGMRYAGVELPRDIASRLKRLAYATGPKDLESKSRDALDWFREIADQVTEEGVRSRLAAPPGRTDGL
jgi:predicted nucleotidyltransferase